MSLDLKLEEHEALAQAFARDRARMVNRELVAATSVNAGLVLASVAIWLIRPPESFPALAAVACGLVLLLSTRVRIDTPFSYTVPTQMAFVPLVMTVPAGLVVPVVVVALLLAALPDVVRGGVPAGRLLQIPGNCWFAVGPAAVFAIAGSAAHHPSVALLLGALAAQFLLDFTISTARFAYESGATLTSQLRDTWVYVVDAGLSVVGWVVGVTSQTKPWAVLALLPLLALLSMLAHERRKRLEAMLELSNAYRGTALVLGDVVEADDGYTGEHSKGVVRLAAAVGQRLDLDAERRRNLEFAALLHDVGKIVVPKDIINKPAALTDLEWSVVKQHTIEGQRMLERVGGFMRDVGDIVRSHHERWDGAGYPDGLAGADIALEARIIACCDTWNAMRTDRAYRRALSHDAAMSELKAGVGTQFDPRVVESLLEIIQAPERVAVTPPAVAAAV
jgi:putative nucleotidyltransferase with HDIG domain